MIANSTSEQNTPVQELTNQSYLDFLGGKGVFSLGYRHSQLRRVLKQKLEHLAIAPGNGGVLATKLMPGQISRQLPGALQFGAFFTNASAALMEAANLASLITSRRKIICTQNIKKRETGLTWKVVPYGLLEPIKRSLDDNTAAVLVEPIQVEGGVVVPNYGYLQSLRKLCDEQGVMLILDESQLGIGRTGYIMASEVEDVFPDLLVTRVFTERSRLEDIRDKGDYFLGHLQSFSKIYPTVVANVRGRGLIVGIEITTEDLVGVVLNQLMEYKILARRALHNVQVIRLEPPLFINYPQLDYFIAALENSIKYAEKLF